MEQKRRECSLSTKFTRGYEGIDVKVKVQQFILVRKIYPVVIFLKRHAAERTQINSSTSCAESQIRQPMTRLVHSHMPDVALVSLSVLSALGPPPHDLSIDTMCAWRDSLRNGAALDVTDTKVLGIYADHGARG